MSDQQLLMGCVGSVRAILWVGLMLQWVGLGWIDENGPTSNSGHAPFGLSMGLPPSRQRILHELMGIGQLIVDNISC